MSSPASLPRYFRKLEQRDRREAVATLLGTLPTELAGSGDSLALADLLIESSVGVLPVPLGVATGFLVDGDELPVPMATEEASVVAAASFGARLLAAGGGISTESDAPVATEQVFVPVQDAVEEVATRAEAVRGASEQIQQVVDECLASLVARGGGFRGVEVDVITLAADAPGAPRYAIRTEVDIDVRDAMGANMVNTAGERLRPLLADLCGQQPLMAIVTNASPRSRVRARGRVPWSALARRGHEGGVVAERIVAAAAIAGADSHRAVTHNKGVMNGVMAVVLATGNDTRAVEAAAHGWAASQVGGYGSLTSFRLAADAEAIDCSIELPVPLGTVGGTVDLHPVAKMALRLLRSPDSRRLARIAAAAGLASNLAAVRALVSEGIQPGHMRLHYARQAFAAGARDGEVETVADFLAEAAARQEATDRNAAVALLKGLRSRTSGGDPEREA